VDARLYAWRRTDDGTGHSFARVANEDDGWGFDATEILVVRRRPMRISFTVQVDGGWHTRAVDVEVMTRRVARLRLEADGDRQWRLNGRRAARLDGCIDVDVAATPLTNTFPIRRLADLSPGEARTSPVAWVDVPSLRVLRVDQTYRRLGPVEGEPGLEAWQYGDPLHGSFHITVDSDGIVLDYEGFASRLR
jgi:uncharacterized protein